MSLSVMRPSPSQRKEALLLARELLEDIELSRIGPVDVARKATRLARLLDDSEALQWMHFELTSYPDPLDAPGTDAIRRSNREATPGTFWTGSLAELAIEAQGFEIQLAGLASTGSGDWKAVERDRRSERDAARDALQQRRTLIEKVVSALHAYVADHYQELIDSQPEARLWWSVGGRWTDRLRGVNGATNGHLPTNGSNPLGRRTVTGISRLFG